MQLRSALLVATILATPIVASAQVPVTGLYVGAGVGVNLMQQENIKRGGIPATAFGSPNAALFGNASGNLKFGAGFAGLASMGWGFGNGLRAEIEGNYRNNQSNGFGGSNVNAFGISGAGGGTTEQKYGGMFNVLYDFNGISPWFVPYIGGGVGYQWINEKNWHVYNNLPFTVPAFATAFGAFPGGTFAPGSFHLGGSGTEGSFAYQAILGAAFPLATVMPGLAFTAEYRFLGTTSNRTYSGTATGVTTAGTVRPRAGQRHLGPEL